MYKGVDMRTSVHKLLLWLDRKIKPVDEKVEVVKMYVLVRLDLEPIHRAVQAGHAVAEYFIKDKTRWGVSTITGKTELWQNGYMIYLGVENEEELLKWKHKLEESHIESATFIEPDWAYVQSTALACVSYGELFKELPLLVV